MGGHRMNYPKDVWTPTGGYYTNSKNAPRNFKIALGVVFLLAIPVFKISATFERRARPPLYSIPSERWTSHPEDFKKSD
ncbi:hypothetical protein C9374_004308 [Naegleria lovaniensis]|uniref:Uncharacterized protein n=1 Tax=Naegleria lovaniensis TaxID=51637 RepID=A0AA88GS93_NAELO|nr:uncharacterized protein C9374_004308 [Naegleria lovaniensis]KAG2383637.1 hypothetical protein C9374_004308 [Naegleria lovaniensis]